MINKLSHRILRRMNYISDQAGIFNRYALELENWSSHLEKTKQYICDYVLKNNFNTVSVLGSGWLLDLPKNKSCLITYIEELRYRKEEGPVNSKNLSLAPLPEGKNIQTWDWLFDTKGTYNKGYKTAFKVIAMEI